MKKKQKVNLCVGDTVIVIAGKDKGAKGKVTAVNPETNRCLVNGVNIVVKHKKARSQTQKAERRKQESGIDISNVQILCPKCDKVVRIGNVERDNRHHRICKKCGEIIDKKYVKPKIKDKVDEKEAAAEDKKIEKKPLARREVKHVAESVIKRPKVSTAPGVKLPRKMGGGE